MWPGPGQCHTNRYRGNSDPATIPPHTSLILTYIITTTRDTSLGWTWLSVQTSQDLEVPHSVNHQPEDQGGVEGLTWQGGLGERGRHGGGDDVDHLICSLVTMISVFGEPLTHVSHPQSNITLTIYLRPPGQQGAARLAVAAINRCPGSGAGDHRDCHYHPL